MRFAKLLVATLALAGVVAMMPGADAAPVKLRVGWVVAGADSPLLMFGPNGVAKHEGNTYTLDAIHFEGTPPMITALAAGELDIAPLAFSTLSFAVQNAHMNDIRIIADVFQDGVPGYYSIQYMVLKNSPVHTVADMKGRIAVSNVTGAAVDIAMRAMFKRYGLEDKRNVTIVNASFPNMKAMLLGHKVDLMSAVPPFSYDPGLDAAARTLFTQKQAIGRTEMIFLVARNSFLHKNRTAVVDYLEDSLRALHWYMNPANHDAAVKNVSAFSKIPAAVYQKWIFTHKDFYRDPNGLPDLKALQSNIETQRKVGLLKADIDVKKYVDLSYVKEAAEHAR